MALDILAVGRAVSCHALQPRHPSRMRPHRAPPSRFLADQEKSGAFGTGVGRTRHPMLGAAEQPSVAVWEPSRNQRFTKSPSLQSAGAALSVNMLK